MTYHLFVPVAQLDRVLDSESKDREFESPQVHKRDDLPVLTTQTKTADHLSLIVYPQQLR